MRDRKLLTLDEAAIKESARVYRDRVRKSLGNTGLPK